MVKRALSVFGLVGLLAAGYALAAGPTITLTGEGPRPALATVAWGDAVTFTNADNKAHSITIPRIAFQSPTIEPGATYVHAFDGRRGNYLFRQVGGGPNFPATIIVNLTGSVTLEAAMKTVEYGRSLRLSGKSSYPGTPVKIAQRVPGGGGLWTPVSTVTADADGGYSLEVEPKWGARYRAQVAADQIFSDPVLISVKPAVGITPSARRTKTGRKIKIVGRVNPREAAVSLDLERFDPRRKRWLTESRRPVGAGGRTTFTWAARKGTTRLRVSVKPLTLRTGWSTAQSPSVAIVGVG